MKALHIFRTSLLAVTVGMVVSACSSDSDLDKPIEFPEVVHSDKSIEDMPTNVTIPAAVTTQYTRTIDLTKEEAPFSQIILLDDYTVVAKWRKTRAAENQVMGYYEVKDGVITATIEDYTIEMPVEKANQVKINAQAYDATMTTPTQSDATALSLCRSWHPEAYQVVVYSGNKAYWNYTAPTITQLQESISEGSGTKVEFLKGEVEKITFLANNTILTTYNDEIIIDKWQWTNAAKQELKATIGNSNKTRDLDCTVRFDGKDKAYLIINFTANMKGIDGKEFDAKARTIVTLKAMPIVLPTH